MTEHTIEVVGVFIAFAVLIHAVLVSIRTRIQHEIDRTANWANEVMSHLQEAIKHASAKTLVSHSNRLSSELSRLIDTGRWIFDNDRSTDWGCWKEEAYQGTRPKVLDKLIDAYNEIEGAGDPQRLVGFKREFVSEVQNLTRPAQVRLRLRRRDGLIEPT